MSWLNKNKDFIVLLILIVVITPILLQFFIFNNDVPSKVSNDGWAGFFGGYIGSIIGAIATVIAIKMELDENKKYRMQDEINKYNDEIKSIRPYLCFDETPWETDNGSLTITLLTKNVGFHAACDISVHKSISSDDRHKPMWNNHMVIGRADVKEIKIWVDLNETEFYRFEFFDIRGDHYKQDIIIVFEVKNNEKLPIYISTSEPVMIKTKEEREATHNSMRVDI